MDSRNNKASFWKDKLSLQNSLLTLATDTLIVWQEPGSGIDMALSFQEAEGCALIWLVALGMSHIILDG
jgi:protein phosphatase 4 regulatory subunit 3